MNKIHINIEELGNSVRTKKLSYKGQTEEYKVYRVPINQLYFNDENGRIATFISQYENEHPGQDIKELSNEEYNDTIAEYIKKANSSDTFKRTLNDIKLKGQLEAGVILDDGRVIDGNRRFTCLRELYNDTSNSKYFYFECVVLPSPKTENDRKELRTLELTIQFGVDEKVTYSAIDRLVSIYNDLLGPKKIYGTDEYERRFNIKKSELNTLIEKAKIMIDYLNFIDKPMMFYIARDYKIDGPIQELVSLKKKLSEGEWDRIKIAFYHWFNKSGDTTRKVRDAVNIYKSDIQKFNDLLDGILEKEEERKLEELKRKFNGTNKPKENTLVKEEPIVEKNDDAQIEEEFSNINYNIKIQKARKKPLELINSACKKLKDIDLDIVECLNDEEINELKIALDDLEEIILGIRGSIK